MYSSSSARCSPSTLWFALDRGPIGERNERPGLGTHASSGGEESYAGVVVERGLAVLIALGRLLSDCARGVPRLLLGMGEETTGRSTGYGVCDREDISLATRPGRADMVGDGAEGYGELRG